MKMVLMMSLMLGLAGCEAKAYQDCEGGEDLQECAERGEETLYCDDYLAPHDADTCRLIAEIEAESIWCCP